MQCSIWQFEESSAHPPKWGIKERGEACTSCSIAFYNAIYFSIWCCSHKSMPQLSRIWSLARWFVLYLSCVFSLLVLPSVQGFYSPLLICFVTYLVFSIVLANIFLFLHNGLLSLSVWSKWAIYTWILPKPVISVFIAICVAGNRTVWGYISLS